MTDGGEFAELLEASRRRSGFYFHGPTEITFGEVKFMADHVYFTHNEPKPDGDCGPVLMPIVPGLGRDTPTAVNEHGGKQSKPEYRCDLLPAQATLAVAGVLHDGAAKYGEDNWRRITVREHLNHVLCHAFAYLAGDESDDHLSHLACRSLMALEIHHTGLQTDRDPFLPPDDGNEYDGVA